ncbi:MAG: peptide deformylase, partial [Flavobacteriaceae bacterium]|nr:peptide deformylase [Flavobacteriaceae bacterium]
MILPILSYGNSVLKMKALPISVKTTNLETLIKNMWETMYAAQGVGLAAPQIGESKRLFIVDTYPFSDNEDLSIEERNFLRGFKKVFINPEIIEETGKECFFNEGCLSIPGIREDVKRKDSITIKFQDLNGKFIKESLSGIAARVVQHEYDHIEGILFTDKLSFLKK